MTKNLKNLNNIAKFKIIIIKLNYKILSSNSIVNPYT